MCPTACVRLTRASRVGELVSTSAPGATASMKALRASIGYLRRPIVRHRRCARPSAAPRTILTHGSPCSVPAIRRTWGRINRTARSTADDAPFLALVLCLTASAVAQQPAADKLVYPVIPKVGGVAPLPDAAEQPRKGAKVVFEITADARPADLNKGVERVARLLNLYGSAGLKASDVKIAMVMHGEATKSALSDAAYKERFGVERNPNLAVIAELRKAGVEVFVCGQASPIRGSSTPR